jgi:hypothetical protein
MSRRFTFFLFGLLLASALGLAMGLAALSPGSAMAQTVSCDTSGTVNGGATPRYGTVGTTIVLTATGFTGGEAVSFWFTAPSGGVIGTARPIPGGVGPDGNIGPLPFTIDQSLLAAGEGRWAVTFEGASSHHQAIIYFCVFTAADATAIAQPTAAPTNTSVPPTSVPAATDTSVPVATDTSVLAATEVPTGVPTELATATTAALPTSTTEATAAPPVPTVPVAPTSTTEVVPLPTSAVPGMPTTGNPDGTLPATLVLLAVAMSILTLGWLVRRRSSAHR